MPPTEQDALPTAVPTKTSVNLKVVDQALELPVVSDAVSAAAALAGPYLPTLASACSPVVEAATAATEAMSPEFKKKVGSAVETLDGLACSGLDRITETLPTLAIPTPDLVEITKEAVSEAVSLPSYWATCASEMVASFAVVQALLGAADSVLGCLPGVGPVLGLRRSARAARRAGRKHMTPGARRATRPTKLGHASLLGALAEVFAINWLLAFVGLEIVAAKPESKEKGKRARKAATEATEDQELQGKFGDLDLSKYDSEQDSDYSASELSGEDDPLEYDSQTEEPEPRFAEMAEAEVLEGDAGAAEDVQIHAEDYNGEGEKIAVGAKADEKVKTDEKVAVSAKTEPTMIDEKKTKVDEKIAVNVEKTEPAKTDKVSIDEKVAVDAKIKPTKINEKMVVDGKTETAKVNEKVAVEAKTEPAKVEKTAEPAIDSKTTAPAKTEPAKTTTDIKKTEPAKTNKEKKNETKDVKKSSSAETVTISKVEVAKEVMPEKVPKKA